MASRTGQPLWSSHGDRASCSAFADGCLRSSSIEPISTLSGSPDGFAGNTKNRLDGDLMWRRRTPTTSHKTGGKPGKAAGKPQEMGWSVTEVSGGDSPPADGAPNAPSEGDSPHPCLEK